MLRRSLPSPGVLVGAPPPSHVPLLACATSRRARFFWHSWR
jgi:hypothetical protein